MSGPTPYFHQSRAMGGGGGGGGAGHPGGGGGGLRTPPPQSAIRSMVPDTVIGIGTSHHHHHPFGSSFHHHMDSHTPTRPIMVPHGDGSASADAAAAAAAGSRDSEKKKRGRPRKYGPDGSGGGGSASSQHKAIVVAPGSGSGSASGSGWSLSDPSQKRGRGRPPGSGKIQRLALLGEWAVSTAGRGFTPHVLRILEGEDIAAKIASFSQQATRAVCVMSAQGAVSRLTLSQPSNSRGNVTYEGRFQIIYMSGSYMTTDEDGTRTRTGDLSIAVSSPEGHVFGGPVAGNLVAATTVQVIIGSFVYLGPKGKSKEEESQEMEAGTEIEFASADRSNTPVSNQNANPSSVVVGWPGPRQMENRPGRIDIDLARG